MSPSTVAVLRRPGKVLDFQDLAKSRRHQALGRNSNPFESSCNAQVPWPELDVMLSQVVMSLCLWANDLERTCGGGGVVSLLEYHANG